MKQLPQIKSGYDQLLGFWQREATVLSQAGRTAELNKLGESRDVLERGIFILMFGQFESACDDRFQRAKDKRTANTDWTRRRGWDAASLQGKKVPFETKLSMVMDKKSATFKKVLDTYAIRNHCAHGGTTIPVGSIAALEAQLYQWHRELKV